MKTVINNITFIEASYPELNETEQTLYQKALEASSGAYACYSHFHVGAAVLLENGVIVTGNNQENAAYPSGLCAERVALFAASAHYPNIPVIALAIIATQEGCIKKQISPCGACCQVITEMEQRSKHPIKILLCGKKVIRLINSAFTLLPFQFTSEDLK